MKTSIEHLPEKKQRELARIQEILFEEFELAKGNGQKEYDKKGRILKIVLFGSYARGDWVDEAGKTAKGYQSATRRSRHPSGLSSTRSAR